MSKSLLSVVQESLENNPDVYIHRNTSLNLPYVQHIDHTTCHHDVDFCITPVKDCFDKVELNKFLLSLKNGRESQVREILEDPYCKSGFRAGSLVYKENFGSCIVDVTKTSHFDRLEDAKLFFVDPSSLDFTLNPMHHTIGYTRDITVRIFPSRELVENVVTKFGSTLDWIQAGVLRLYMPGFRGDVARFGEKLRGMFSG
jgi:hypothetical protein